MFDLDAPFFPPEFRLVAACSRWPLHEADRAEIRRYAAAVPDWRRVAAWAHRHGVSPLVHGNLQHVADISAPAEVAEELRAAAVGNAGHVLMRIAEAARIMDALAKAGIKSMTIKGPTLSTLAFGDPALRTSQDIDLLVDSESVAATDRLMIGRGYQRVAPDFALTPKQFEVYRRRRCQMGYWSPDKGLVEIHWRLTTNPLLFPLRGSALWEGRRSVDAGGARLTTLADENLFLYLCAHGSLHAWFRLKWLADVAALLRQMPGGGIERMAERAEAMDALRPFHQAMILAHALLDTPVPPSVLAQARKDASAIRAARAGCRALVWRGVPAEPAETRWFNLWINWRTLLLQPRWRYRWAELQAQACSPEDWNRIRLPERLFFLYIPLRPVSWLLRQAGRTLGRRGNASG